MGDELRRVIEELEIMRGVSFGKGVNRTLNDALALLKGMAPRVLSLEEAMKANVCWIEERHNPVILPCDVTIYTSVEYPAFIHRFTPYSNENIPRHTYGVTWRCWSAEPGEEQRRMTEWEN